MKKGKAEHVRRWPEGRGGGGDDDGDRKSKIWQLRLRAREGRSIGGVEWAPPRRARDGGRLRGRSEKKMDEVALRRR